MIQAAKELHKKANELVIGNFVSTKIGKVKST